VSTTAADPPRTPLKRVVLASLVGTTIEWYDFFLYGTAAALVFNKVFFHQKDPLVGAMLAFTTYALGFVARPVGGVLFGHFGDRIGRKKLLMLSLILMGVATFAIGLLPTYSQVGVLAPLLLVALRLIQGLAVGGEWGGAILLVAESGHASRRGFWASWPQVGVPIGNLLAAGVLAVMSAIQSEADFLTWGWRVAFLLSAVLVGVGYWIRVAVTETPAFDAIQRKAQVEAGALSHMPAVDVFRHHGRGVLIGAGLRLGENICYYVITAFSITYITEVAHLSRGLALNAVLAGAAAEAVAIPLFGILADKIGRRPVYAIGAFGSALWGFGFFWMINTGLSAQVICAVVIGLVLHGAMYGPQAAFIAELFSTKVRYTGASIAYQATSIVAGSLAPIVALALLSAYNKSSIPVSIYVCVTCCVSAVSALLARETKGRTFEEIDAAAEARIASANH
jgi:metabolite-proton symporter